MSRIRSTLVLVAGLLAACGGPRTDDAVIPSASTTPASPTTTRTTVTATVVTTTTAPASSRGSTTVVASTVASTTSVPVPVPVPWDEVGPGWFLVTINHQPPDVGGPPDHELLLVSPSGTTHTVARWSDTGDGIQRYVGALDWTEDGRRVLLRRWLTVSGVGNYTTELVDVDLVSGLERVVARFDESEIVFGSYADPAGTRVVSSSVGDDMAATIDVRELDGTIAATLWTGHQYQASEWLALPEGDLVLIGPREFPTADLGPPLTLVHLDGSPGPPITPPPGQCWPAGRWTPTVVLVACVKDDDSFLAQLWTIPIGGEEPEPLTNLVESERDYGATGAWQLPDGTIYLERLGDCTGPWVDMLMPDGTASVERVTTGRIVTTFESKLGLHVGYGCVNEGGELLWFDPRTEETSMLVQSAEGEVGIEAIVPWGRWLPQALG